MLSPFHEALHHLANVHDQEVAHLRAELLLARRSISNDEALTSTLNEALFSLRQSALAAHPGDPQLAMPGEVLDDQEEDGQLLQKGSLELVPSPKSTASRQMARSAKTMEELSPAHDERDVVRRATMPLPHGVSPKNSTPLPGQGLAGSKEEEAMQLALKRTKTQESSMVEVARKPLRRSKDNDLGAVVERMTLDPVWRDIYHMSTTFGGRNSSDNEREKAKARMSREPTLKSHSHVELGDSGDFMKLGRSNHAFISKSKRVTRFYDRESEKRYCQNVNVVASPLSRRRLIWDFAGLSFLFYDLVMVPLQVFEPEDSDMLAAMNLLTCIFWTCDLIGSFFVGYHSNGQVEMRVRMICIHYMKSWFALDLSLVAMDWCFLIMGLGTKTRFMRLGKVAKCARVLRLCRVLKFHIVMVDMADRVHSEYKRTWLGIAKLLLFIVAINHFIACAWYGLHHLREGKTWVLANFDDSDGLGMRYWTSMHWSMTQFTPASMEVVPVNSLERFYTVCVLVFALVTFSSFVSSITQSMTHLRNINARELEQQSTLHRYLAEHTISSQLVNRILHFIRDRRNYARKPTRMKEVDVHLFQVLPESVKMELRTEVHVPIITVHPLFYNYNLADPSAISHICKNAIQEKTLIQREELFAQSATANQAVFMSEGRLIYTYPTRDFAEAKAYINKGDWVCEAFLWAKHAELFGPLVAETSSEMVLLSTPEFVSIVKRYDVSAKYIARYAELFVREVNKDPAGCRWASILCNNFDSIRDLAQLAFEATTTEDSEANEQHVSGNGYDASASMRPGEVISKISEYVSRITQVTDHQAPPVVHAVDVERHNAVDSCSRRSSKNSNNSSNSERSNKNSKVDGSRHVGFRSGPPLEESEAELS